MNNNIKITKKLIRKFYFLGCVFLYIFLFLSLCFSLSLLTGCASVIEAYPDRVQPAKDKLNQADYSSAIKKIQALQSDNNTQLIGLELGRTYQLAGQYAQSQQQYDQVLTQVRVDQEKAKIEVSRLLSQSGALLINPQAVSYRLMPYEVVYLLGYQALNELGENDPSNALVYLRQAYEEQQYIESEQAKEMLLADQKSQKEGWKFNPADHAKEFNATMTAASHIKNGFENAWVYYLTALVNFSQGNNNDAFVAIKQALSVAPENPTVRNLLLDILVQRGGDLTQLNQYLKNFGLTQAPSIPEKSGLVVFMYEQGWVPEMQTVRVPIPLVIGVNQPQIQWISFPVYQAPEATMTPLSIQIGSQLNSSSNQTAVLLNVYDLAAKNLKDRYPLIFVQAVLSALAKAAVTASLSSSNNQNADALFSLAGSLYGAVMSNADCRSWLTLPRDEQIWQEFVPAGNYPVQLSNFGKTQTVSIKVLGNQVTLIWVVQSEDSSDFKARVFNF